MSERHSAVYPPSVVSQAKAWLDRTDFDGQIALSATLERSRWVGGDSKPPTERPGEKPADNSIKAALIGAAGIIIAAIIALPALSPAAPPPPEAVLNCAEQQREIIELLEDYPNLDPGYTGPSEEQCQLNALVSSNRNEPRTPTERGETTPERVNPNAEQ